MVKLKYVTFSHSTLHFYITELQSFQGVKKQEQQGFVLKDWGKETNLCVGGNITGQTLSQILMGC
jgi:hypothetical protein